MERSAVHPPAPEPEPVELRAEDRSTSRTPSKFIVPLLTSTARARSASASGVLAFTRPRSGVRRGRGWGAAPASASRATAGSDFRGMALAAYRNSRARHGRLCVYDRRAGKPGKARRSRRSFPAGCNNRPRFNVKSGAHGPSKWSGTVEALMTLEQPELPPSEIESRPPDRRLEPGRHPRRALWAIVIVLIAAAAWLLFHGSGSAGRNRPRRRGNPRRLARFRSWPVPAVVGRHRRLRGRSRHRHRAQHGHHPQPCRRTAPRRRVPGRADRSQRRSPRARSIPRPFEVQLTQAARAEAASDEAALAERARSISSATGRWRPRTPCLASSSTRRRPPCARTRPP